MSKHRSADEKRHNTQTAKSSRPGGLPGRSDQKPTPALEQNPKGTNTNNQYR